MFKDHILAMLFCGPLLYAEIYIEKKQEDIKLLSEDPSQQVDQQMKSKMEWNNSPVTSLSSLVPGHRRNALATFMSSNCIRM